MLRAAFAASLALAIPTDHAYAATWDRLDSEVDGDVWYADRESVRSAGDNRYVWLKVEHIAGSESPYASRKLRYKINCSSWTMRLLDAVRYDTRGRALSSQSVQDYRSGIGMEGIAPDTMADAAAIYACR